MESSGSIESAKSTRERGGSSLRRSNSPNNCEYANRTHSRSSRPSVNLDNTPQAVDAQALTRALEDFEDAGRQRDTTPSGSPSRKRQRVYGDRFVPNRQGQDLQASFSLLHEDGSPSSPSRSRRRPANSELHFQKVRNMKPSTGL